MSCIASDISSEIIPLRLLMPGQTARVHSVVGQREQVRRLEELGFRSGTDLELISHGSPCIVRLAGNRLCIRDCQLLQVMVSPRRSA